MKFQIECRYCNFTEIKEYYSKNMTKGDICKKCRDKNLKITDVTNKIDYYEGCKSFPVVKDEDYDNYL